MLKGKKPEIKEKRLKMFVYGEAGIGKTVAALQFPNAYIIDTERGTDFYAKQIVKTGSVVLQTLNPDDIKAEIKELLITKHKYKTLIIDPITQIYNAVQEKWTRIFEKNAKNEKEKEIQDFGMRYWGKVKGEFKALQRMLLALDMNVIVTAHQKDVYGTGFSKVGVTFDSMRGDDYLFDIIFRIEKKGKDRVAVTVKERALMDEQKFPAEFEWSYDNFLKFYGKEIIEREATPIEMATDEDVIKLKELIEIVKIDDEIINKWLTKADADDFAEFTKAQIIKCIAFVEDKIKPISEKKIKTEAK
jgi:hypothetical protein